MPPRMSYRWPQEPQHLAGPQPYPNKSTRSLGLSWKRSSCPSSTRHSVNLCPARRWWMRGPRGAAIETGTHVAAVGGAGHTARLALVESQIEHRMFYLDAHIGLRP